jgi:filamentous hemagglutinin
VNCSVATDSTLAGNPASALPTNGPLNVRVLEKHYGKKFSTVNSQEALEQRILRNGDGARGIVFGVREGKPGHVFNVVNQNGTIRFLDGQTGKAAVFADDFVEIRFLRTN